MEIDKSALFHAISVERMLDDVGVTYYSADTLPAGCQVIEHWVAPEKVCSAESDVRDHWNKVVGEGVWAVTPSTDSDGAELPGLVDIVSVPGDRPSVEEMIGSVSTHVVQGEGRPPLRPVQD